MMIAHGATDWNGGLYVACFHGHVATAELMIAHGATDLDKGLIIACINKHKPIAELMIAHGATKFDDGLYYASRHGHFEITELLIAHGVTNWDVACKYGKRNMKEYIKAQWKLHDAKAVPIIRMLRRCIVRLHSTKRIQRWWRGTYPLWRELAYAPPNGVRYLQSLTHFEKNLNILKKIENSKKT